MKIHDPTSYQKNVITFNLIFKAYIHVQIVEI